jgi:hypothetical protein
MRTKLVGMYSMLLGTLLAVAGGAAAHVEWGLDGATPTMAIVLGVWALLLLDSHGDFHTAQWWCVFLATGFFGGIFVAQRDHPLTVAFALLGATSVFACVSMGTILLAQPQRTPPSPWLVYIMLYWIATQIGPNTTEFFWVCFHCHRIVNITRSSVFDRDSGRAWSAARLFAHFGGIVWCVLTLVRCEQECEQEGGY